MDSGPLRDSVFVPGMIDLCDLDGSRRRGRPRNTWADQLEKLAAEAVGNERDLSRVLLHDSDRAAWHKVVNDFIGVKFAAKPRGASADA